MLVLHAHSGFGNGAHDVHYAVLGAGVLGLVALLSPRLLAAPATPRDEHEARVEALRSSLARSGALAPRGLATVSQSNLSSHALDPNPVGTDDTWLRRAPALTAVERALLPLAVVSSAAAAGTHAAVLPPHLDESLLFGAFFAGSALLQLLWAGTAALRCSRGLLVAGALGNLAVIGLWAITRTLGLPFGLLPGPEALGPWDVACGAWELVVVCSCVAVLQSGTALPARLVGWRHWHPVLPTYVAGSVLLLIALSVSGAGA
jgi:hypothetical protein